MRTNKNSGSCIRYNFYFYLKYVEETSKNFDKIL